jgi:SHS2 domain-containing protein
MQTDKGVGSVKEAGEKRGYKDLDHTADKAVEVWGESIGDVFVSAAEAMFSVSHDLEMIGRDHEWTIAVEAESPDDLLHAWLSELLWVSDRDGAVPCEFSIEELDEQRWKLRARARGGPAPAETPTTGAPVKAVTYHELHVWREDGAWKATVVFDV